MAVVTSVNPESTDSDDSNSGSSSAAVGVIVIINIAFFFVVLVVVPSWSGKMPQSFPSGGNSLALGVTADGMITVAAAATADGTLPFSKKRRCLGCRDGWMLFSEEKSIFRGLKEINISNFSSKSIYCLTRTLSCS